MQNNINLKNFSTNIQMPEHKKMQQDGGLPVDILRNTQQNYYVQQFYTTCLAEAAYFIKSGNEVAIVDPLRDTEPYIQLAEKEGLKIKYIFMTHFHADFVSGHQDLALKTGAKIVYGPTAQTQFEAYIGKDNEEFQLGDVQIRLLHTPGHTQESSSFLIVDNKQPQALFTGDTLFLGEVGRPDLAVKQGSITKEDLASWLYDSLHNKILTLPDSTLVYPGHGPGSPCGKSIQEGTYDLLGNQKQNNYALQFKSKEEFIKSVTSDLPKPPGYFFHDVMMNKEGGSANIDEIVKKNNNPLSLDQFKSYINDGYTVLDTRGFVDYLSGFVPKSYNVDLGQSFALWVGKLMTPEKKFVLICDNGREKEAVQRLCRIGYDNVKGYLEGGINAWKKSGQETISIDLLNAKDFEQNVFKQNNNTLKDIQFIDVRNPGEQSSGYLEGSYNLPLWEMEDYIKENPKQFNKDKPVYLTCQRGARGVSAASIFSANGYKQIFNIEGGMNAILQTDIPIQYKKH